MLDRKLYKKINEVRLIEIYEKMRDFYPSLCNSELRDLAIREFERVKGEVKRGN
jgi:hypothetical protein